MRQVFMLFFFVQSLLLSAQGYIVYDSFSASTLRDEQGSTFGSGGLHMVSAGYRIPLSAKRNGKDLLRTWSANVHGRFAEMENTGEAKQLNPGNIVNAGMSVTHSRQLSKKWSVVANVGCGVYAPSKEMTMKSVLGSGGALFICQLNGNLSLGVGAGITNSYGAPMAMPMLYLNWHRSGKYEFCIDMSNQVKLSAATWVGKRLRLELTPLEVDGLMAVTSVSGKERIYSMMMMQSCFSPSYHFSKKLSVFASVGGNWIRGVEMADRSLKGFFENFTDDSNDDPYFQAALRLSAGIKFSF